MKSVVMAFPSYTQLMCINVVSYSASTSTSQAVSLKVDQAASILKLF